MRIEQSAVPLDSLMAAHSPSHDKMSGRKLLGASAHPAKIPSSRAETQELECEIEGKPVRLRGVQEVVTDEAGHFYEVNGGQLRPLGELVRDEHGRIFEVHRRSETSTLESTGDKPSVSSNGRQQGDCASREEDRNRAAQPHPPAGANESSPGYRKILADPGLYLKISWGRVKFEMAGQLKHPEQISDDDEIECYAQIYEAQRTLPATHIAARELGDGALHLQLHPLTPDKAKMLGVAQLFKPTRYPFEGGTSSRQLHAGQRVYRLWPLFDPTAHRAANPVVDPPAPKIEQSTLLSQIPQRYLDSMHFRYSREEVLYDMKSMFGTLPPATGALRRSLFIYPLRLLKVLMVSIASYGRIKKWEAMLDGKSADEQLWTVTPPRGFSYHPRVRRWVVQMLGGAGYDAGRVLIEWEIFWRRKGVESN